MPIDPPRGETDRLIDGLVADLAPVEPRRWQREAALIAIAFIAVSLAAAAMVGVRADMPIAVTEAAFWWKAASLVLVAAIGSTAVVMSLDPAITILPRLRRLATAAALLMPLALAAGALMGGGAGIPALVARLDWHGGIACVRHVAATAVPILALLVLLIRRGAPTDPARTAAAAGFASAGISAAGFVASCPHDDPLYVTLWYGLAVLIVTGAARLLLPRLIRW